MKEPKIRFNGFEGEWEEHSLSENEFSIVAGGDIDKTNLKNSGKFPVIANAITNDGILGYYENSYRVQEPAVTVTGRGEVGIAVARHYSFTPVVRLLSIKSPHNVDFLANAINCYKVPVESTGVPQLTTAKLQEYRIPMPRTIEEEDAIASFFTTIDAQISASTSRLASLKQIKAASLQAMFPQEGETVPKLRFKGFEGEWETPSIAEVFELRNGYTPSKAIDAFWEGGTIPWFRMEDIRENGGILHDAIQHITPLGVKGNGLFEKNSIILSTTATIGVHAILIVDSLANQQFTNFSIRKSLKSSYDPMFVYYSFFGIDEWSKKNTNSGGLLSVNIPLLLKQPFLTPSFAEQCAIASYFTNLDRQITLQTQRLEKLKQIKAACLDKMFV